MATYKITATTTVKAGVALGAKTKGGMFEQVFDKVMNIRAVDGKVGRVSVRAPYQTAFFALEYGVAGLASAEKRAMFPDVASRIRITPTRGEYIYFKLNPKTAQNKKLIGQLLRRKFVPGEDRPEFRGVRPVAMVRKSLPAIRAHYKKLMSKFDTIGAEARKDPSKLLIQNMNWVLGFAMKEIQSRTPVSDTSYDPMSKRHAGHLKEDGYYIEPIK